MEYKWEINYNFKPLNKRKFNEFAESVADIVNITNIVMKGVFGINEPEISNSMIGLNGNYHNFEHYESLAIRRILDNHVTKIYVATYYDQCDTGNKPYDTVIAATLLLFKHQFPTQVKLYPAEVNDSWKKGYELAEQVISPLEALEMLVNA